jgi:hypothetical protein
MREGERKREREGKRKETGNNVFGYLSGEMKCSKIDSVDGAQL